MKKIVTAFIFFCGLNLSAQQYGAQWVVGPNQSALDFGIDTIILDTLAGNMGIWETSADICDSLGNLLYYTNGYYIADKNGATLLNGDTLSPSALTSQYYIYGNPLPQAAVFLPKPDNQRYYYLIHFAEDTLNRPRTIYYSLIDKEGNSGLGAVIRKNVPILKLLGDTVLRGGGMTACKHGNGRDYWIVALGANSNEFYKFLLTPDTILGPFIQFVGPVISDSFDLAYSKFTQDGSKYATSTLASLILVMDFDRCSGEFSNPATLFHNASINPGTRISGCISQEFSPNGRFLYAANITDLTQYDLWSGTIQDSIQIWNDSSSDAYGMNMLQVAPNGKIYASSYNGGLFALHVINNPDSIGASCFFAFGGQPTLSLNSSDLPNMINYKLGPLIGSGCDTLTTATSNNLWSDKTAVRIIPNPADKYAYVEMGMQGNYEMQLLNEMGQLVATKQTRQVDIFDTERLASGEYFLRVTDMVSKQIVGVKKVVVQH